MVKKEIIPKLLKAIKTAKDESAVNGLDEIRVPFRETDLVIEALEELELALDVLVYFEFDTPCEKMRDDFCEDYCMVKDEVGPDKECWLHYLTQKREERREKRQMIKISKADKAVKPIVDVDTYKCSNCGHKLEEQVLLSPNILFHEFHSICPGCGREVKWDA